MATEELIKEHTLNLLLENTAFSAKAVENFRRELLYSAQNSIDSFLENRPEYLDIGKAVMAAILIRYEHHDTLWRFTENNWMRYLIDRMRAPNLESFPDNQVAFVTFNFDRSFDYFMYNSLRNTFGADVKECTEVIRKIPIIHLHGRLGWLPWQNDIARIYDSTINPQVLRMCMDNIKLIHEELDEGRSKEFEEAKRLMEIAERIYFLGFGFSQINVERLAVRDLPSNRAIATATGFTQHEVTAIAERCGGKVSIYPQYDIQGLFRNVVAWS